MDFIVNKIIKHTSKQIEYKNTIATGEITKVNGDGTYDVKIANAGSAMPNIETLNYGDTFFVGEIVDIGYEYGNKESIKILGHSKKIKQNPIEVEVDYSGGARITTLDAYGITSGSGYLEGEIKLYGIGNCTRRGFKYGLTTSYGSDIHEDGSYGEGVYNLQITELDAEETYHYQAYVTDANGDEQVGEDKTMMTSQKEEIATYALIVAYPNEIQVFDMDGILEKRLAVAGWSYAEAGITIDSQGNIYTKEWDLIKKYDSNLNLLLTKNIESGSNWIEGMNIGVGYLYTLEGIASGYDIKKRSLTDLTIQETFPLTADSSEFYFGNICIDSDGNMYVHNDKTRYLEKYNNLGVKIAELNIYGAIADYRGMGIMGNLLYWSQADTYIRYAPLDLSTSTMWDIRPSMKIGYCLTAVDDHLIVSGWDADNDGATAKYDSGRNLVWIKKLDPTSSYAYKAGGYNF